MVGQACLVEGRQSLYAVQHQPVELTEAPTYVVLAAIVDDSGEAHVHRLKQNDLCEVRDELVGGTYGESEFHLVQVVTVKVLNPLVH